MLIWVEPNQKLPPPTQALTDPNGLLAAGRDLSPARLLEAYSAGVFPWYSEGQPVLWWSPDPRMVLFTDEFRISRSFAKTLRRVRAEGHWRVTLDAAFAEVVHECAAPRPDQDGTWITPQIAAAYTALHRAGNAHSVEVWEDDALVGGLYGVTIGRMYYGESMFARRTDASKCALAALVGLLRTLAYPMIDCQQNTRHLASLGAREIPRLEFLARLADLCAAPQSGWQRAAIEFPDV